MPQPWKHPKLGTYYCRKVVPEHLREPLGRLLNKPRGKLRELRLPLGTKNAQQAKLLFPEKEAEAAALLARAAGNAVHLTHQQVVALAGKWYGQELAEMEAEPGDPEDWDTMLGILSDAADDGEGFGRGTVAKQVKGDVDRLLASERLNVDSATRAMIEERVFWLSVELYQTLKRRAEGDYSPDAKLQTFPEWRGPNEAPKKAAPAAVAVFDLFDAWAKERRPAPKTKDQRHVGEDHW